MASTNDDEPAFDSSRPLQPQRWCHLDKVMHQAAKDGDFEKCDEIAESLLLEPELPLLIRGRAHVLLALDTGTQDAIDHAKSAIEVFDLARSLGRDIKASQYARARWALANAEKGLGVDEDEARKADDGDTAMSEADVGEIMKSSEKTPRASK